MSPCLLLVVIHMVFGQWSDSRHFLYFSEFLVLPQYETVQFLPPLPEVGKQGFSVLMFHEATYQSFIVHFTLLKEVFPSLVCARAKSELSNHSVFLSTLAHMRVGESTLTRVVKPRAHRHLVLYLPSVQLYRSSATFHTGWCSEVILICPQLLCYPLLVLSLLVQSFPSPPCSSSQDDGRSSRVDHNCFIFALSQPYGAISLSHLVSVDNNTSYIFSFTCLRLMSNGCYCFVSVTGLGGSTLLSVSIRSFFCLASSFFAFLIYSSIAVAQIFLSHSLPAWRPRVGVNFPQSYRRQIFCEIVDRHCRQIPSVGTIRPLSIQFVFRGVEGGWPFAPF